MPLPSSSAQRALEDLGARLREIRTGAGLSGRDLGRLADWHSSKISKIEHGRQTPSDQDIRTWCEHCGVADQAPDLLAALREVEGMFIEWSRLERDGLRRAQEAASRLFDQTRHFRAYDSWLVPGLLQTSEYTSALLEAVSARRNLHGSVDAAVAVRMQRQKLLHEGDRRFAIIIEESVLRGRIGGVDTMISQLAHLLTVGSLPSTSFGIIPSNVDRDIRPVEGFWIFGSERVNVELVSGWLTLTHPRDVAMYAKVFARLSELAVYGTKARALITAAIDALGQLDPR